MPKKAVRMKLSTIALVTVLSVSRFASAQTPTPPAGDTQTIQQASHEGLLAHVPERASSIDSKPLFKPATQTPFFSAIRQDTVGFFSMDTAKIIGPVFLAALAVHPMDHAAVEDASERMSTGGYHLGAMYGSIGVQAGLAATTYIIGRATGKPEVASLGSDLIRAQLVSQMFVQGAKFAVKRERPDGSNSLSFPSGHTASAFATATVFQQHYGWKAGIPAYAAAGFVGASRMAGGKHYLTDVMIGAGIGIAVGHTVTLHVGKEKFALGGAPTQGGGMVTFTKK